MRPVVGKTFRLKMHQFSLKISQVKSNFIYIAPIHNKVVSRYFISRVSLDHTLLFRQEIYSQPHPRHVVEEHQVPVAPHPRGATHHELDKAMHMAPCEAGVVFCPGGLP